MPTKPAVSEAPTEPARELAPPDLGTDPSTPIVSKTKQPPPQPPKKPKPEGLPKLKATPTDPSVRDYNEAAARLKEAAAAFDSTEYNRAIDLATQCSTNKNTRLGCWQIIGKAACRAKRDEDRKKALENLADSPNALESVHEECRKAKPSE